MLGVLNMHLGSIYCWFPIGAVNEHLPHSIIFLKMVASLRNLISSCDL